MSDDRPRSGGYQALGQSSGLPRPWWQRVPAPMATVAVKAWSALPRPVRAPFVPVGRWINPHHTTSPAFRPPGPDSVAGVAELRAQGFEPIEEYTGTVEVAALWPEPHRRWVAETRPAWVEPAEPDPRLWLVRSPWPSLSLADSLNVLWAWAERDRARLDADLWRQRVVEALAWDDATAVEWHRRTTD